MKTAASLLVSVLLMISTAFAANNRSQQKTHKSPENKETQINQRINGMIGSPLNILHGNSQSVMISYSVDENNVMHVREVATSNQELKVYIMKHLDGRTMKKTDAKGIDGIVKVHFNANEGNNIYLQF